ncbi:MAG: hypothetical protein ACRYGP_20780 [Janthinobacterium lividum]
MITGKQIREARALMGLQRSKFAEKAGVPHAIVRLAEMSDDDCPVTLDRARQIRRAIEAAGIELFGEGAAAGVRRRAPPTDRAEDTAVRTALDPPALSGITTGE